MYGDLGAESACSKTIMTSQQRITEATAPVRALLADDSPIMIRALVGLIKAIPGVSVDGVVYDGAQAVEKAVELAPDVVLLDFRMPQLDGLQAADRIREKLPAAKILILSLHDQEAIRREAEARSDGFISKADLRERLPQLLEELFPDRISATTSRH